MATAVQDNKGKWKIEGLSWEREEGKIYPEEEDLSFTGTISYKKEKSVPVTITETPEDYDTTWETPLGVGLVASEIKVNCSEVTRKVEGKWYTYVAVSGFKQSDIEPFEASLSVDCTNKNPGSQATTATLKISCNTIWEASVNVPWITIPTTTGSRDFSESISFDTNTGTTSRIGVITVTSLDKTETITITQSGFVPEISLTAPETVDATAISISYTATSNVDDVVVELSDGQRKTDKIGSFEIPENTSSDQVTYTLTAYCANYTTYAATTTVIQNGIELLTPEVKSFDISTTDIEKQGGKINLTAETLPTGHTISVENLPSWITVDTSSTEQNWVGKVSENSSVDERSYVLTGTVTTNEDPEYDGTTSLTKTWTVTQAGSTPPQPQEITVSPTSIVFDTTGGTTALTITDEGGCNWEITDLPEEGWLNLSQLNGNTSAVLTVTCGRNEEKPKRKALFKVINRDTGNYTEVTCEQDSDYVEVDVRMKTMGDFDCDNFALRIVDRDNHMVSEYEVQFDKDETATWDDSAVKAYVPLALSGETYYLQNQTCCDNPNNDCGNAGQVVKAYYGKQYDYTPIGQQSLHTFTNCQNWENVCSFTVTELYDPVKCGSNPGKIFCETFA